MSKDGCGGGEGGYSATVTRSYKEVIDRMYLLEEQVLSLTYRVHDLETQLRKLNDTGSMFTRDD